jgi:hypothetical protein
MITSLNTDTFQLRSLLFDFNFLLYQNILRILIYHIKLFIKLGFMVRVMVRVVRKKEFFLTLYYPRVKPCIKLPSLNGNSYLLEILHSAQNLLRDESRFFRFLIFDSGGPLPKTRISHTLSMGNLFFQRKSFI